jgi:hypothetical protein
MKFEKLEFDGDLELRIIFNIRKKFKTSPTTADTLLSIAK